jgi:16S rRNA (uracil1498-N3)-methyltransferase
MRSGDALCVFDGNGTEAAATIRDIARDAVSIELGAAERIHRESPLAVTLAVALSRGDRMDTVVQKATELGVRRIQPVSSERTGVRLDAARLGKKRVHWERVAISACEQCGRNVIPRIDETLALTGYLAGSGEVAADALRLILHPDDSTDTRDEAAAPLPERPVDVVLLVGPEGGFSEGEVAAARAAGFHPLQLGPRVLRTETAPLAALAALQLRWGDFSLGA